MSLRSEVSLLLPLRCRDAPQITTDARRVELSCFKDALMASKGDTILVVPGWFIILTNMPWQKFLDAFKALDAKAQKVTGVKLAVDVIKVNEERRFALARLVEGKVEATFARSETREVIQRIRGRLLALAEVVEAGLPEEYKPVVGIGIGERLEALARAL